MAGNSQNGWKCMICLKMALNDWKWVDIAGMAGICWNRLRLVVEAGNDW